MNKLFFFYEIISLIFTYFLNKQNIIYQENLFLDLLNFFDNHYVFFLHDNFDNLNNLLYINKPMNILYDID